MIPGPGFYDLSEPPIDLENEKEVQIKIKACKFPKRARFPKIKKESNPGPGYYIQASEFGEYLRKDPKRSKSVQNRRNDSYY